MKRATEFESTLRRTLPFTKEIKNHKYDYKIMSFPIMLQPISKNKGLPIHQNQSSECFDT
jgi:hypothetical protein